MLHIGSMFNPKISFTSSYEDNLDTWAEVFCWQKTHTGVNKQVSNRILVCITGITWPRRCKENFMNCFTALLRNITHYFKTVGRNSTKNQMAYFSGNFLQYESLSASHGHLEKYVC